MSLEHVAETELVADGMTKQLTGQPLLNFKRSLRLRTMDEKAENIEVKRMELNGGTPDPRFLKVLRLMIVAASMVTRAEASETAKEEGNSEWWILVLLTAAIAILGDIIHRVGSAGVQRWFKPKEELKVKLPHPEAILPSRGSEQAARLDLHSTIETMVQPGDSVLIKTGIALELPRGSYGRVAPRSSLAIRGIETGAGVIDRDFRGEVKVLLRNHSDVDLRIYKGDRVAQLVVEKILEVKVNCVEELSSTARGSLGFGYSAHEDLYPWAEPDDPTYQRQELGTSHPVDRISVRALRMNTSPWQTPMASAGQTPVRDEEDAPLPDRPEPEGHHRGQAPGLWHRGTQTEMARKGELFHDPQEPSDELRVPDSELWCRGAYDAEAEERRRANLGLNLSAWDRYMVRRGPRRNHGGTCALRGTRSWRWPGAPKTERFRSTWK